MDYEEFFYPENLLRKVSFFGWSPPALAGIAAAILLSIALLLFFGMVIPLAVSVLGAILTFGVDDLSIYQIIKTYGKYLLTDQTEFFWDSEFEIKLEERKQRKNVSAQKQRKRSRTNKHRQFSPERN